MSRVALREADASSNAVRWTSEWAQPCGKAAEGSSTARCASTRTPTGSVDERAGVDSSAER